jgi:hypothetical protein
VRRSLVLPIRIGDHPCRSDPYEKKAARNKKDQ